MTDGGSADPGPAAARSIWLVGSSGAGKSTVGPILARRLGWDFIDLDAEIERRTGTGVAELFDREGEEGFRSAEAEASEALLDRERIVVATGGGWMARDDLRRGGRGCARVWLRVTPETAARRLVDDPAVRPLLSGPDPEGALRTLLERRSDAYSEAEIAVETEGRSPSEVVTRLLERLGGG
jgi:shikimate kinase